MVKRPDPNSSDVTELWTYISTLETELEGPTGFSSWKDAAVAERIKRVELEKQMRDLNPISL